MKAREIKQSGFKAPGEDIDFLKEKIKGKEAQSIQKGLKKYVLDPQSWH